MFNIGFMQTDEDIFLLAIYCTLSYLDLFALINTESNFNNYIKNIQQQVFLDFLSRRFVVNFVLGTSTGMNLQ